MLFDNFAGDAPALIGIDVLDCEQFFTDKVFNRLALLCPFTMLGLNPRKKLVYLYSMVLRWAFLGRLI